MKKIIFILIAITLINPSISFAHPGGTDSSGCHTCRTNCSSWGLSTGEYHCHNNKGTTQPSYPIHSTYGSSGTGYTTPAPDYAYPSIQPLTPTCPINARYDGSSCKCNYGYVASGSICITEDSWCHDKYGYGSEYDILDESCKCSTGYAIDSSGKCSLASLICVERLGLMSRYNSLSNKCECMSGYVFDGKSCISGGEACQSQYGPNSYGDENNCYCLVGYEFNSDKTYCITKPKAPIAVPVLTPIKTNSKIEEKKDIVNKKTESINVKKVEEKKTPLIVETPKIESEAKTISEPVKKLKWYQKIFNWLF